ncbi:Gfo/Idh/MocA family protein [Bdellovibrio bacteriovorus]
MPRKSATEKIRYAVVGLGHIAQDAVLPAFKNAKNCELTALISGDPKKLKVLGRKYKVKNLFSYDQFDECMKSGLIDAVYIATPNINHREFTERAARHGIHVLTEKPMAIGEEDGLAMVRAAKREDIKLMVAYRLHFDPANLRAIEIAQDGKLGDLRIFNSVFTFQITDKENIRLQYDMGGGPLYDIGIYCLNASRYLFRDEPIEAFAMTASSDDERFNEVEEMMAVTLRFPKSRLATFVISFGAAANSTYDLLGTEGTLRLENCYDYVEEMHLTTTINDKKSKRTFKKHDQFAPELEYFAECILKDQQPEPSAEEGLLDIKIIEALYDSVRTRRPVKIDSFKKMTRPSLRQEIRKPAHRKPDTVHVRGPHD